MISFRKDINLSGMGDKRDVILEPYTEYEKLSMFAPSDSEGEFFYMYLSV